MEKKLSSALASFSSEAKKLESTYNDLYQEFRDFQKRWKNSFVTLQNVVAYMSDGLLFVALSGVITVCNPALCRILNLEEKEIKGHLFCDLFPDQFFGFSLREFFHKPSKHLKIRAFLNQQETHKEVEVTASNIPQHGIMIMLKDLSSTELDVATSHNKQLQEIGQMAAALAHEIRNPLGGIQGFASLLATHLESESKQHQMAIAILDGAKTLNRLVSSVLSYGKPLKLNFKKENLKSLLLETQALCLAEFQCDEICSLNIETPSLELLCDKGFLKSAFLNLWRNAAQAADQRIAVDAKLIDNHIRLCFENDGDPIKTSDLNKVFTPFFTTKTEGTGLGLAEVKKIIEAHGGSIEVQVLGTLTRFNITLKAYGKNSCY